MKLKIKELSNTIAFIGPAKTDYALGQISIFNNLRQAKEAMGDCSLIRAYEEADEKGLSVVLINSKTPTDFVNAANLLRFQDYRFIVPIGINMSDKFYYRPKKRQVYYMEILLDQISESNTSILVTDRHASNYLNIDHYLKTMKDIVKDFKSIAHKSLLFNGENLYFVANNLKDEEFSNIKLAIALCLTKVGHFPIYNFGEALFDIYPIDINYEMIFFQNNTNVYTSIENYVNFRLDKDLKRYGEISTIAKFIILNLNFDYLKGRTYGDHIKMRIFDKCNTFLASIVNKSIIKYSIDNISLNHIGPGENSISIEISVIPISIFSSYTIRLEV